MTKSFAVLAQQVSVCQPPTSTRLMVDRGFRGLRHFGVFLILLLVVAVVVEIGGKAVPGIQEFGAGIIVGMPGDPKQLHNGIQPAIWGTLYSSLLGLLIGGFFGVTVDIFLTQGFLPPRLAAVASTIGELLAAIPSVVYGLWGIFVVIPAIRPLADCLHQALGWLPFFNSTPSGPGPLPAAIVLGIMILPTTAAVSQDALRAVPLQTQQAAHGMDATHWEAVFRVMLPNAATGIFGALLLGLGRALGETMALAMLIGNSSQISLSLFSPADTLAALLALNFPEGGPAEVEVLMYVSLVLVLITLVVNFVGSPIRLISQGAPNHSNHSKPTSFRRTPAPSLHHKPAGCAPRRALPSEQAWGVRPPQIDRLMEVSTTEFCGTGSQRQQECSDHAVARFMPASVVPCLPKNGIRPLCQLPKIGEERAELMLAESRTEFLLSRRDGAAAGTHNAGGPMRSGLG